MNALALLGKTVFCLRGDYITDKRKSKKASNHEVSYVLFDDKETLLELEPQCYYTYIDCDGSAKVPRVHVDKELWNGVYETHYEAEMGMDRW